MRLFRLCIRCSNLEIHRHDATLAFAIGSGEASAIADDDEVIRLRLLRAIRDLGA